MFEYYFCEECQEYHYPNRIINGEILAACECQIKTDSGDQIKNKKLQTGFLNYWPKNPQPVHINHNINIQYSNSPTAPSTKHSRQGSNMNMPFMNIISEENKKQLEKIKKTQNISGKNQQQLTRVRSQNILQRPKRITKQYIRIPPPSKIESIKHQRVIKTITPIQSPIQSIKNLVGAANKLGSKKTEEDISSLNSTRLYFENTLQQGEQKDCCYKCCYF